MKKVKNAINVIKNKKTLQEERKEEYDENLFDLVILEIERIIHFNLRILEKTPQELKKFQGIFHADLEDENFIKKLYEEGSHKKIIDEIFLISQQKKIKDIRDFEFEDWVNVAQHLPKDRDKITFYGIAANRAVEKKNLEGIKKAIEAFDEVAKIYSKDKSLDPDCKKARYFDYLRLLVNEKVMEMEENNSKHNSNKKEMTLVEMLKTEPDDEKTDIQTKAPMKQGSQRDVQAQPSTFKLPPIPSKQLNTQSQSQSSITAPKKPPRPSGLPPIPLQQPQRSSGRVPPIPPQEAQRSSGRVPPIPLGQPQRPEGPPPFPSRLAHGLTKVKQDENNDGASSVRPQLPSLPSDVSQQEEATLQPANRPPLKKAMTTPSTGFVQSRMQFFKMQPISASDSNIKNTTSANLPFDHDQQVKRQLDK